MTKIMMKRANVILNVSPEDKDKYMEHGYSVIDDKGSVIEEAIPTDVHELQKLVKELKAELKEAKKPTRKTVAKKLEE